MQRHALETIIGVGVLCIAVLFVWFAYRTADVGVAPGYTVGAVFAKVGGLAVGNDVRISGIKVGTVTERYLDPRTYEAVVKMTVDHGIRLPVDTVAAVGSEGVLGGRFIELEPGQAADFIPADGEIRETRSYRSLEDQVGEIIFLATSRPGDGP
jgi:phospholipid/cholesterol/gamma-HCH transport system substrate-binding protein